jgi:signal peptidase
VTAALVRNLFAGALLVAALGWLLFLRPQVLGGPAAYVLVSGSSMEPTLDPGSLVIAFRQDEYEVGELVVYRVPAGSPASGRFVIHRIVGGSPESGYVLRGDNVSGSDIWRPTPTDIIGRSEVVVPGVMPVLLFARSPIVAASAAAALAVYLLLGLWATPTPSPSTSPSPSTRGALRSGS